MTDKKTESAGDAVAGLVLTVGSVFLDAWAISLLWGWFVVPLGPPPIGYWHAMWVGLLWSLLSHRAGLAREGEPLTRAAEAFLAPLFFLAIGAMVKAGMS